MADVNTTEAPPYTCPVITNWQSEMMQTFSYWVEGVCLCAVSNIGIIINLISSIIILTRKEMRNCFNILLVGLAAFDTWYLFGAILESIRKYFPVLKSDLHVQMFPMMLYPVHQTSIAGSIFMTVAIAFERYTAVHFPMNYNQALNDQRLMKKRVIKYLVPVSLLSFAINIPKFFESKVEYADESYFDDYETNDYNVTESFNSTMDAQDEKGDLEPYISLTDLRTHPWYSLYNSWSRFLLLGLIPFCLLVFFNTKIYRDIKERKKRRMINNLARPHRTAKKASVAGEEVPMVEVKTVKEGNGDVEVPLRPPQMEDRGQQTNGSAAVIPAVQIVINEATSINPQPSVSENASSGQSVKSLKKTHCSVKKIRKKNMEKEEKSSCCLIRFGFPSRKASPEASAASPNGQQSSLQVPEENHVEITDAGNGSNISPNSTIHKQKKKDIRRKNEDSLAMIFVIIILIFLVCHAPRIILDINELANIKQSEYCASIGQYQYSVWSIVVLNVSHFLLVVNSSVNMIVYCLMGSRFRTEIRKIFDSWMCWLNWNNSVPVNGASNGNNANVNNANVNNA